MNNSQWHQFLLSRHAEFGHNGSVSFPDDENISGKSVHPLTHFGLLTLSGQDAAKLLQGQTTCNVNDISAGKSSIAAMCNPKGRAIATFILARQENKFLIILPLELVEIVREKLQMYVLRSDVKIVNSTEELCILGLTGQNLNANSQFITENNNGSIAISLPGSWHRKILIAEIETALNIWAQLTENQGYRKAGSTQWKYMDIASGLPWLTLTTSEEFIPQMLNLDKLGGISFNKGCYTGQEVVARTHYLGKVKREMQLAECSVADSPAPNSVVVSDHDVVAGHVLQAQWGEGSCKLQIILQADDVNHKTLKLRDYNFQPIHLLPFAA